MKTFIDKIKSRLDEVELGDTKNDALMAAIVDDIGTLFYVANRLIEAHNERVREGMGSSGRIFPKKGE